MSTLSDSLVVPENIFEKSQQILKDASSCVLGLRWTVQPQLWRACPTPFMLSLMLEASGEPLLPSHLFCSPGVSQHLSLIMTLFCAFNVSRTTEQNTYHFLHSTSILAPGRGSIKRAAHFKCTFRQRPSDCGRRCCSACPLPDISAILWSTPGAIGWARRRLQMFVHLLHYPDPRSARDGHFSLAQVDSKPRLPVHLSVGFPCLAVDSDGRGGE